MEKAITEDFKPRLVGILLLALAIGVAAFAMVSRFALMDLDRDMKTWQEKLNLIADSRANDVNGWVNNHFTEMKKLSEQPSLQLYLSELSTLNKASASEEPPQRTYLRNLITFAADRLNFTPTNVPLSVQKIPADIPYAATSGLVLLNANGETVVASPYLSALPAPITQRLASLPKAMPNLIDMYKNDEGVAMLGFVQPIFGIQADPSDASVVGQLVGIKPVDAAFTKLLKHPGTTEKSLEVLLVRSENGNVVYLSPTEDGSTTLTKRVSNNPETLAEAYAIANPGAFSERNDYGSTPVLITGRAIAGTPWTLVVKINKEEALHASNMRRNDMVLLFSALIALILATIVAVWYNASSRRAIESSARFQRLAETATAHERLLELVTNNQVESVFLLDEDARYCFANRTAGDTIGVDAEQMLGKTTADVLGPARAAEMALRMQAALASQEPQTYTHRIMKNEGEMILQTQMIPLAELPLTGRHTPGLLISEQDITELMHERERAERTHQELIDTLVMMVDRRDPHAGGHSKLVSELALEIAAALDCDKLVRETAKTAGLLLNVGKILIPEATLTSTDKLNETELRSIRESVLATTALLKQVSFDGPVVDTLNQSLESIDGSGPQGMKGEEILISARIVAVANALVGMISPRAYRPALSLKEAINHLVENVDTTYDRKIVFALVNFLENQGGSAMLNQWMQGRKAA